MIETITFVYTVLLLIQIMEPLSCTTGVGAGHPTIPLFQQNCSCRRHQVQTVIILLIITNDPTLQVSQSFFQLIHLQRIKNMFTEEEERKKNNIE